MNNLKDLITCDTYNFIKKINLFDKNRQKRILFMVEASLTLYDNVEYYTDFNNYYLENGEEQFISSPYHNIFLHYHFFLKQDDMLNNPTEDNLRFWNEEKIKILDALDLPQEIFKKEYERFKFGLTLKKLRKKNKNNFSKTTGLSIYKINIIEDYCYLAKV